MLVYGGNFRKVFWFPLLPALISVALLFFFVQERPDSVRPFKMRPQFHWRESRRFSPAFWFVVAVGALFTLARFSEAFLVLRASSLGLGHDYVPLVLVVMNVVYASSSYPAGHLSDRLDRRLVLAIGGIALILADTLLARATGIAGLVAGIAFWGLHMGFSQGLLAALVADAAPTERRGNAFGLFNLVSGIVLTIASVVAGKLWDRLGAPATFVRVSPGWAYSAYLSRLDCRAEPAFRNSSLACSRHGSPFPSQRNQQLELEDGCNAINPRDFGQGERRHVGKGLLPRRAGDSGHLAS